MLSLLRSLYRPRRARRKDRLRTFRPTVENLEDRRLLATAFLQTNLVSDLPGVANILDPNLVNPWGISESSTSAFWISDNNSGVSTLYNGQGQPQPPGTNPPHKPLIVSIPTPGDPLGASGAPTGTVFNTALGNGGFKVTNGTTSAPAIFLFATEDGTIVGWNPAVNPVGSDPTLAGTFGTLAVDKSTNPDGSPGAVYKGLAIATGTNGPIFKGDDASTTVIYAANFRSGKIDVFDTNFKQVDLPTGAFTDPNLPKGYAPFNVQELTVGGVTKIYVTYAKQNADKHDDVGGQGNGFVDVFNLDGTPGLAKGKMRLISRGPLDSPWGLVIAPSTANFGNFAGALLVGNFGNGFINAFNPTTGKFLGTLKDPDGEPIQIDGLWALQVGNGAGGGDANTIYFTAGLDHEQHGLFGSLSAVAPGTPEGPAEAQKVQAALDIFQLNLNTLFQDIGKGADGTTIAQDVKNFQTARAELISAEVHFAVDEVFDGLSSGSNSGGLTGLDALFASLI
jgi:uncharacterized protein (TIGR03118 family)